VEDFKKVSIPNRELRKFPLELKTPMVSTLSFNP